MMTISSSIDTDGSKEGDRVGCAVVFGWQSVMECLPDMASIYTAELRAIYLALHDPSWYWLYWGQIYYMCGFFVLPTGHRKF